jgi:hypothetical protein
VTGSERLSDIGLKSDVAEAKDKAHFSHHRRVKEAEIDLLCQLKALARSGGWGLFLAFRCLLTDPR